MSILNSGYVDDEYCIVIKDRNTRLRITNTKYGELSTLLKNPLIIDKSSINELIDINDKKKIIYTKYTNNTKRITSVFELESDLSNLFSKYVVVRFDLKSSSRRVRIDIEDYFRFINHMWFILVKTDIVLGWCYGIEKDKYGSHVHLYLFLDGNRYNGSVSDNEKIYRDDISRLEEIFTNAIFSDKFKHSKLKYLNFNIVDLSDKGSKRKLVLVGIDDLWIRNCVRYWLCYICKNNSYNGRKSYGKCIFKKKIMDSKPNSLYDWTERLDRLIDASDWPSMDVLMDGVKYHQSRIDSFFSLEEEVFTEYNQYLFLPFKFSGSLKTSNISDFTKKYNSYKYNSKVLISRDIAYCWVVNVIDKTDLFFNVFLNYTDTDTDKDIGRLIYLIKKWFTDMNGLPDDLVVSEDTIFNYQVVSGNDIKQRNRVRYHLAISGVTNNENRDIDGRNIRSYAVSKVKKK